MSRGFPEKINSMSKEEIELSIKRDKDTKKKYNTKHYKENKDYYKKYYEEHKGEKIMSNSKEYNAKYYQEHKKEISEKRKSKYKNDEEYQKKCIERANKWVKENREKWTEYMRAYRVKQKLDRKNNV